MNTTTIVRGSGAFTYWSVQLEGLDKIMSYLSTHDSTMRQAIADGLKEASQPVLTTARANARSISDNTDTSTASLESKLKILRTSSSVKLTASGEEVGVKEFANRGSSYSTTTSDKRANAREMGYFPTGVPAGSPPRVMVPAVNSNIDNTVDRITAALQSALEGFGE